MSGFKMTSLMILLFLGVGVLTTRGTFAETKPESRTESRPKSKSKSKMEENCSAAAINASADPAVQGMRASLCRNPKISSAAHLYEDWFRRLRAADWKGYDFPLSRDEWMRAHTSVSQEKLYSKVSATHLIETLSRQLMGGELSSSPSLMRFWIRISPCLDGEDAGVSSMVFLKWISEETEKFLIAIVEENRNWKNARVRTDSCISAEEAVGQPVLITPIQSVLQSFPKQKLSPGLKDKINRIRATKKVPEEPLLWDALLQNQ